MAGVSRPRRRVARPSHAGRPPAAIRPGLPGPAELHQVDDELAGAVDEMESAGLLVRRADPVDRRRHALLGTAAGRRVRAAVAGDVDAVERGLFDRLPGADRAATRPVP